MCTLSIFRLNEQTIITMNRDEYRIRAETNTIKAHNNHYYPVDKTSGGTWFGFNSQGIVMALLNRYQDTSIATKTSRGTIIPTLLESTDRENVLNKMITKDFNPFDLIAIQDGEITLYSWNRKRLSKHVKTFPYFHTSSSIDSSTILNHRQQIFNKFYVNDAEDILLNLHLLQTKDDESRSIYMSRDLTHTKSISQLITNGKELSYHYFTEQNLAIINKLSPYRICQTLRLNASTL